MGGGGVSGGQLNRAVAGQQDLATTGQQNLQQQYNQMMGTQQQVTPYYSNMMTNGLPFYRNLTDYSAGTNAQAFAPQRAQLLRQTSQYSNLPSGYRDALLTNLGAQQARSFDSTMVQNMMANQMAKNQGAAGLTGEEQIAGQQALGYGGLAGQSNQSIIQGPQKPSVLGTIGGLAIGGANAAANLGKAFG